MRSECVNRNMTGNKLVVGLVILCAMTFLDGCSNMPLLDPKGPIGASELILIAVSFALMLLVVIPVIFMAIWFPRRFNATNPKGEYAPKWSYSFKIELVVWLVPAVIVFALSVLTWTESHRLDPFKPIASTVKPVNIQAVSFDWKWLFIYPDQNVATVNHLVLPAKTPLNFKITSDTVMTSFFIPQLGSQIYAMGGMQSRLHLLADEPGHYTGQNQQFSGDGYPDMHFGVDVVSQQQFENWLDNTKQTPDKLDLAHLKELRTPEAGIPVTNFSSVMPGLFNQILNKYHRNAVKQMAGSVRVKIANSEEK